MKNHTAILTLIIAGSLYAYPQTPRFYHEWLYKDDPNSSDIPSCLFHDSKGFMWFGERSGLKRYDGYNFKAYYYNWLDTTSLSDNYIISMYEDNDANIWMGSFSGGLVRYNRDADNFTRFPRSGDDPYNLKNASIWAICQLRSGTIWFSAQSKKSQGIYAINPRSGNIIPVVHDISSSDHPEIIYTRNIYEDRNGNIWTADPKGLHKYDSTSGLFINYNNDPDNKYSLSCDTVNVIYEDRSGTLWIGTYNGLNQFDQNANQFIRYYHDDDNPNSLSDNYIGAITGDNQDNLFIKTVSGINFLNKLSGSFILWKYIIGSFGSPGKPSLYLNYPIYRSLVLDTCGVLWFPTYDGFNKIILKRKQFIFLQFDMQPAGICQDNKGDLWIGTWGYGLYRISTNHPENTLEALQTIMSDEKNSNYEIYHYNKNTEDMFGLGADYILTICQDKEGNMWFGSGIDGILYNLPSSVKKERFIPYRQNDSIRIEGWQLTQLFEDQHGILWIGKVDELEIFDRVNKKFIQYDLDPGIHEFNYVPTIDAICQGESGCIWIGTFYQGLFKIIPPITVSPSGVARGKGTLSYNFDQTLPKDLGANPILALCEPRIKKTARLWIGTAGGGLFGLMENENSPDGSSERFVHYTKSDGLPSDIIWGILDDDRGNLWISTQNGFSKFDPQSGIFNNYNEIDGVPDQTFVWLSKHKGKNGELYFGTNTGLLAFHPDSITDNPFIPPVVITNFKLFNKPVPMGGDSPLKKSITETTELELSYRENYLSFEFAALNYINTEKNRYKYMIEGLDKDWIDAGATRTASYSSMKHGKYTFRVIGSNNDGVWNEEGASINIIIHPPPWLTWWAYTIYGLMIIGVVLWYRSFIIRREKLKADLQMEKISMEKMQEVNQMKSRFFANISHEFRTPLTLILGPLDDIISGQSLRKEPDRSIFHIMRRSALRLKGLIEQVLDLSRLETGQAKLMVSEGNISEFLKTIVVSFLSLAESKNIGYKYSLPEIPLKVHYDSDKLEKIVTNLISNAFKFTPQGGKIKVGLSYISAVENETLEYIEIKIQDTGSGIPGDKIDKIFDRFYQFDDSQTRKQEGTGIGLALTKELVNLYRGEINVESEPGKGSIFKVRLPVSKKLFREEEIIAVPGEIKGKTDIYYNEILSEVTEESEVTNDQTEESTITRQVVLIVEDNVDLRNYISRNLEYSYKILEADDGSSGFIKATDHIPDLIITDLMMPGMDGMELCRRLKTDERTSHIPVIILTARADMDSKLQGLETGADDYLIKPFNLKELQVRVKNLIELRKNLSKRFNRDFFLKEKKLELTSADERFINKAKDIIQAHLDDPEFNVRTFSQKLGISSMQLYRKLEGIANQSPSEFIRNLRLQHSAILLEQNYDNIAQIAYQVGFNDHSYYTKCFHKLYGVTPAEYAAGRRSK